MIIAHAQAAIDNAVAVDTMLGQQLGAQLGSGSFDNLSKTLGVVGAILQTVMLEQVRLGLPAESPAVILDDQGKVVAYAAASELRLGNSTERATLECLRLAARRLDSFQLDDLNLRLCLIGENGQFDCAGGVYVFGPSYLTIFEPPEGVKPNIVFSGDQDYGKIAINNRRIQIESYQGQIPKLSVSCSGNDTQLALTRDSLPQIEMPPFLLHWYKPYEFTRFHMQGEVIDPNDRELQRLMCDLHEAAYENVNHEGGPFAAAIISPDGYLVSFGVNRVFLSRDATAHGERSAIDMALKYSGRSDLSGYTLVTSSINCISCSDQAVFAKLRAIYFGNSRQTIEDLTPFTEGRTALDFLSRNGVQLFQIRCDEKLETLAFRHYSARVALGTARSYLNNHSST